MSVPAPKAGLRPRRFDVGSSLNSKHQGDGYVSSVPGAKVPLYSITSPARRNIVCGVLNPGTPERPLTALHAEWSVGELRFFAPSAFRRRWPWPFCAVQSALRLKRPQVNDYASLSGLYGVRDVRRGKAGENRRGRDRARGIRASASLAMAPGTRAMVPNALICLNSTGDCP
jgi:hypothetical protein